jgi:hypothetical protein
MLRKSKSNHCTGILILIVWKLCGGVCRCRRRSQKPSSPQVTLLRYDSWDNRLLPVTERDGLCSLLLRRAACNYRAVGILISGRYY